MASAETGLRRHDTSGAETRGVHGLSVRVNVISGRQTDGEPRSRRVREEGGQALVEFALVLPVLLVVLLAIISFATTYNNWQNLTDAVRVAGRAGATQTDGASACTAAASAFQAAMGSNYGNVTGYTCTYSGVTVGGDPGVMISAGYPFSINLLAKVVSVGNMTATAAERLG
jgi:Flp pilus assembly protein TadG